MASIETFSLFEDVLEQKTCSNISKSHQNIIQSYWKSEQFATISMNMIFGFNRVNNELSCKFQFEICFKADEYSMSVKNITNFALEIGFSPKIRKIEFSPNFTTLCPPQPHKSDLLEIFSVWTCS